jgi:hypothetical protein
VGKDEAECGVLGPITVVSVSRLGQGEKGAVAAVVGFEERDVRIGSYLGSGLGGDADEGIVAGVEEKRGDGDTVEYAG